MQEFIKLSDLFKPNIKIRKKEKDEIDKEIINHFIYGKPVKPKYNKLISCLSMNKRNLVKNLFFAQNKNRLGIILDFEGIETESKDHELTIMSAYDLFYNKFYFSIEELIKNLNNKVVITFNEKYDVYMLLKELTKKGYRYEEDCTVKSKSKKIITRYVLYKNDETIDFITFDLMNIFPSDLHTLSKLLKKYLEENEFDYSLIPDNIKEIFDKYGIEKGIEIDGKYFSKEPEIKSYLLSKGILDYFLTEEYKIYNIKDVCITTCLYVLYDRIYSKILKDESINRKKITIPSIAYQILVKNTSKQHAKSKKFQNILKKFKISYKGGLTYFEKGIYKMQTYVYDVNSSYPTSMNITGINIYNFYVSKKINELKESDYLLKEETIKEIEKYQLKKVKDILVSFYKINDLKITKKYPQLKTLLFYALNGYYSVVFFGNINEINKNSLGFNLRLKRSSCNLIGKINIEKLEELNQISKKLYNNIRPYLIHTYVNALDVIRCDIDMEIDTVFFVLNNNNTLRKKIIDIYQERIRLKSNSNPFELVLKLIMNSSYGKLGTSLDTEFKISSTEFTEKTISNIFGKNITNNIINLLLNFKEQIKKSLIIDNVKLRKYYSEKEKTMKYEIRPANDTNIYQTRGFNYILAGTITAYSRLLLETYIKIFEKNGYKNIYNDTDSIIVYKEKEYAEEPKEILGNELGLMKKEKTINELLIFGRKIYIYKPENINKFVYKTKGINFVSDQEKEKFTESIKSSIYDNNQISIEVIKKGDLGKSVFKLETKVIKPPETISNKKTTLEEIIEYYKKKDLSINIHISNSESKN